MITGDKYRAIARDMAEVEGKITASKSGEVKRLSRAEIKAIEKDLTPPKDGRPYYRSYPYV